MKNPFKRNRNPFKDRDKQKQNFVFYAMILSGVYMLGSAIAAVLGYIPPWLILIPVSMLILIITSVMVVRNWKIIWLYITNVQRGKLMLYLNANTHFIYEHRLKLVKWAYPTKKEVRADTYLKMMNKLAEGETLTDKEKAISSRTRVFMPQQLLDGFNKAMTVDAIIYAHTSIQSVDQDARDFFELTEENICNFNLQNEINKCK